MGDYALYIWPCYSAVVLIMSVLGFISWNSKNNDQKKFTELNRQLQELNNQDL